MLEEAKRELDRVKQKLEELMKQRAELIYIEKKNWADVTEEGELENFCLISSLLYRTRSVKLSCEEITDRLSFGTTRSAAQCALGSFHLSSNTKALLYHLEMFLLAIQRRTISINPICFTRVKAATFAIISCQSRCDSPRLSLIVQDLGRWRFCWITSPSRFISNPIGFAFH